MVFVNVSFQENDILAQGNSADSNIKRYLGITTYGIIFAKHSLVIVFHPCRSYNPGFDKKKYLQRVFFVRAGHDIPIDGGAFRMMHDMTLYNPPNHFFQMTKKVFEVNENFKDDFMENMCVMVLQENNHFNPDEIHLEQIVFESS